MSLLSCSRQPPSEPVTYVGSTLSAFKACLSPTCGSRTSGAWAGVAHTPGASGGVSASAAPPGSPRARSGSQRPLAVFTHAPLGAPPAAGFLSSQQPGASSFSHPAPFQVRVLFPLKGLDPSHDGFQAGNMKLQTSFTSLLLALPFCVY